MLLEVEAPLDWLLCEITPSWLPEHVTTEIVGDANTSAVARAVAVRALGFCYLEGSHSAPPIVDPDSRNASQVRAPNPYELARRFKRLKMPRADLVLQIPRRADSVLRCLL